MPPYPQSQAINQRQLSTLVKTPHDLLKPFILPKVLKAPTPPQFKCLGFLVLAFFLPDVLMVPVNHTSGTIDEHTLKGLFKAIKQKLCPPSQKSCNLITLSAIILSVSQFWPHASPTHHPISSLNLPPILLAPALLNIRLKQRNSGVLRWPLGSSLCCRMSCSETPEGKIGGDALAGVV